MRLYSIQHIDVYQKLLKYKSYKTDKRFICSKNFQPAYEWMSKMMSKYAEPSLRPIFCYTQRPDLRSYRHHFSDNRKPRHVQMVLLEIEVPAEKVLVSDFSLWHFVLNDYAIFFRGEEKSWKGKENSLEFKKFKEKTWERCLKIPTNYFKKYPKDLCGNGMEQACIPEIELDYIKKATYFTMINKAKK